MFSSQEVWLQPLEKWCIPASCSWWLSGDNAVAPEKRLEGLTVPQLWPHVVPEQKWRITSTRYTYFTLCGIWRIKSWFKDASGHNVQIWTVNTFKSPSYILYSVTEATVQKQWPSFFFFHLRKSIMAFSVWWHFNTYKCMQWGSSVLHRSPVWRFKLVPFLLNSLYYSFLIDLLRKQCSFFRVGICVFKNR